MKRLGFKGGESNDVGRIWSMCFENGVSLVDQALEAPASGFLQRFDGSAPPRPLSDVNVEPTFYLNRARLRSRDGRLRRPYLQTLTKGKSVSAGCQQQDLAGPRKAVRQGP